eukprot:2967732-Rhodomonas_salina.3
MRLVCSMLTVAVAAAFNLSMVRAGSRGLSAFVSSPHLPISRLRGGGILASKVEGNSGEKGPGGQICHLLVDMDSVIVDWDGAFLERWLEKHPEVRFDVFFEHNCVGRVYGGDSLGRFGCRRDYRFIDAERSGWMQDEELIRNRKLFEFETNFPEEKQAEIIE